MSDYPQVTRDDVLAAAKRISGAVERTPLIEAEIRGKRAWLKCESLQTGGSFKLRGATNRLMQLSEEERGRGVVAFSSGNHAQGVAIAAKRLGIEAIIVMPSDAPSLKVQGTRAQGAEIVFFDRATESREEIAARIAAAVGDVASAKKLVESALESAGPFLNQRQARQALEQWTAATPRGTR